MHQPAENDETHHTPQPEAGERAVIIGPHAVVIGHIITGDGNIVESDTPEWFAALRHLSSREIARLVSDARGIGPAAPDAPRSTGLTG